jgi:ABC-type glycerol-3-phosphate transport system permease component
MWTMRGYFAGLPKDLEEAAMVYGCTEFQAFYKVILPISLPAIIAVSFISFLIGWNDFEFSNMLVTTETIKPATVALYTYTISGEQISWGPLMAMTFLIGVPPMILYLLAQRFIVRGFGER